VSAITSSIFDVQIGKQEVSSRFKTMAPQRKHPQLTAQPTGSEPFYLLSFTTDTERGMHDPILLRESTTKESTIWSRIVVKIFEDGICFGTKQIEICFGIYKLRFVLEPNKYYIYNNKVHFLFQNSHDGSVHNILSKYNLYLQARGNMGIKTLQIEDEINNTT